MDEKTTLIVELDSEVQAALQNANVDLIHALRDEGVDVRPAPPPAGLPASTGTKGIELLILSIGAAAPFAALAIERIIRAVTNRPVKGTARRWAAARDAKGEVVKDNSGNPVMDYTEEPTLFGGGTLGFAVAEGGVSFLGLKFTFKQQ